MTTNISHLAAELAVLFKPDVPESRMNIESTILAKLKPLADRLAEAERRAQFAACPRCHGLDIEIFHHQGSFALPEVDFFVCSDCGAQFGHG